MSGASENAARTIFVVEDDILIRELVRTVLTRKGYTVLEASDGDQALEKAAAWEGTIDLLISDVVMPKLSGLALAKELREARPGVPVLFCSGYAPETIPEDTPFLPKPFTPEELLACVEAILDS